MARTYAPLLVSIWNDPQFVALTEGAQRLYFVANSQPNMTYCGVVPFMPVSWSALATNNTATKIRRDVKELEKHKFVILDPLTEELWVKSFIKHNNVLAQPNVEKAMKASYETVRSQRIKQAVYRSVPEDHRSGMSDPFGKPPPKAEPLPEGSAEGVPHPNGKGVDPTQGYGSRESVVSGFEPQPESEPSPQPEPPLEPELVTPTAASAADGTDGAEPDPVEAEDVATPQDETPDYLVDLVLAICSSHPDRIRPDAVIVVAHLRRHLDARRIEECLGWCAKNLKTRVGNPRFLVRTMEQWAARDGIVIPPLPSIKRAS
jgi:hypothetical protein